jgi:hypothetical protein
MKQIYKIYDCSNSTKRQVHRNGGGPIKNDVMRQLQKEAHKYGFTYVTNPIDSDVIITNDVYPDEILLLKKPLIKRMDGVYWLKSLISRNELLNTAAQ